MWPAMYASRERASITTIAARPALRSTDKCHDRRGSVACLPSQSRVGRVGGRQIRYGYAARGMDSRAPVRPPLDRFQRAFGIDFRVLLAAINPAVLLGLRPVLTRSPPGSPPARTSAHEAGASRMSWWR